MTSEAVAENPELAELEAEAVAEEGAYQPGQAGPVVEEPEPEQSVDMGQMIGGGLTILFGLIGARKGVHWELHPQEAEKAGAAYAQVLDEFWPDMEASPKVVALSMAATVSVGIFAPRIMMDKQLVMQAAKKAAESQEGEVDGEAVERESQE